MYYPFACPQCSSTLHVTVAYKRILGAALTAIDLYLSYRLSHNLWTFIAIGLICTFLGSGPMVMLFTWLLPPKLVEEDAPGGIIRLSLK